MDLPNSDATEQCIKITRFKSTTDFGTPTRMYERLHTRKDSLITADNLSSSLKLNSRDVPDRPVYDKIKRHGSISKSTPIFPEKFFELKELPQPEYGLDFTDHGSASIGTVEISLDPVENCSFQDKSNLHRDSEIPDKNIDISFIGDNVRAGKIDRVISILSGRQADILNCTFSMPITLDRLENYMSSDGGMAETLGDANVELIITLFHLAIISKQTECVKVFIKKLANDGEPVNMLQQVLTAKVKINFGMYDKNSVHKDDRSLDGMTAMHLAARHDPISVVEITRSLKELKMESLALDLFEERDNHLKQTPLHIAAQRSNTAAARSLIEMGADVHAKDYRSFTPLHYASKTGKDENVVLLLENDADPNSQGHRLKTPLHKARSPTVVQILHDYGASAFAKTIEKSDAHEKCEVQSDICMCHQVGNAKYELRGDSEIPDRKQPAGPSVFDILLQRNPKAAEALLNDMVSNNGKAPDSSDFLIVYDLELFQKGSEGTSQVINEMSTHSKILDSKSDILLHPLSALMLQLKWGCLSRGIWLFWLQYFVFVLSLTGLAALKTFLRCKFNDGTTIDRFTDVLEKVNGHKTMGKWFYVFCFLYTIVALNTAFLFIRELVQAIYNWKYYSKSKEDMLEAILVTVTFFYLLAIIQFPMHVVTHLGAWSVFLSWIEFILFLGRSPKIGLYIHMFTSVLKTLLQCILVYSPLLVAFAASFCLLMPENEVFSNPMSGFLKVLVMMIGELEYQDNFALNSTQTVNNSSSDGSTQLLFLLFLATISIIIVNLLVGLTVGEIENLKERARQIRLNKMAVEIIRFQDVSALWHQNRFMRKMFQLFVNSNLLKFVIGETNLFTRLKECNTKKRGLLDDRYHSYWKVCVRPIDQVVDEQWLPALSLSTSRDYNVYIYNGVKRSCGAILNIKISASVVKQTMDFLQQKEEAKINRN